MFPSRIFFHEFSWPVSPNYKEKSNLSLSDTDQDKAIEVDTKHLNLHHPAFSMLKSQHNVP